MGIWAKSGWDGPDGCLDGYPKTVTTTRAPALIKTILSSAIMQYWNYVRLARTFHVTVNWFTRKYCLTKPIYWGSKTCCLKKKILRKMTLATEAGKSQTKHSEDFGVNCLQFCSLNSALIYGICKHRCCLWGFWFFPRQIFMWQTSNIAFLHRYKLMSKKTFFVNHNCYNPRRIWRLLYNEARWRKVCT